MGKQDIAVNRLLERKAVFADLINGSLHGGRQVVKPDELEHLRSQSGVILKEEDKSGAASEPDDGGSTAKRAGRKAVERTGDIRMRARNGMYSVIFANETQSSVHHAMPVRNMLYDSLEYMKQVQDLEKEHREKKERMTSSEFLSGMKKGDRLLPVINTVFYLGEKWDGSRSLHEMLDLDWGSKEAEELLPYLPDYRLNLIPAREIEHPENYRTCLRHIFGLLRCDRDKEKLYEYVKEHREELDGMDQVERQAALILLGEQKRLRKLMEPGEKEEKEERGMCQAITDLILDGEARGRERGRAEGIEQERKRMSKLILALAEEHKEALLVRAASDEEFRARLFEEYNI